MRVLGLESSCDETAAAVVEDAASPAAAAPRAAEGPAFPPAWRPWLWPGVALALLLGAVVTLASGRTRRAFKLDHSADLSRLLQGVLQQPGAFGAMSALLYRPLVPLVGAGAISLQRARELAAKLPSSASRDFGQPFGQIFKDAGFDFYKIDPALFAPAEVWVSNLDSGSSFHGGALNMELLRRLWLKEA